MNDIYRIVLFRPSEAAMDMRNPVDAIYAARTLLRDDRNVFCRDVVSAWQMREAARNARTAPVHIESMTRAGMNLSLMCAERALPGGGAKREVV